MADEVVNEEASGGSSPETEAPEAPKTPPGKALRELVDAEYPGAILEQTAYEDREDEVTFVLADDALVKVATYLRDHPASSFKILTDLTAAHYPDDENTFQVVYQLVSVDHSRLLRLKEMVKESQEVPTVSGVWSSANWMEREVYDLFGVKFKDHPDPRRIFMPEDWGSHPFRKDYPLEGLGERVYEKPKRKEIGE
ncbi:MAG: NADH-quinone oxidoreductase subunit C [Nitrospinaceae bacterium]|nr:NADH-quinone oxidoreductase subunit C [Nitrospinaceae bacterium]